jgi:hypothetical protein
MLSMNVRIFLPHVESKECEVGGTDIVRSGYRSSKQSEMTIQKERAGFGYLFLMLLTYFWIHYSSPVPDNVQFVILALPGFAQQCGYQLPYSVHFKRVGLLGRPVYKMIFGTGSRLRRGTKSFIFHAAYGTISCKCSISKFSPSEGSLTRLLLHCLEIILT